MVQVHQRKVALLCGSVYLHGRADYERFHARLLSGRFAGNLPTAYTVIRMEAMVASLIHGMSEERRAASVRLRSKAGPMDKVERVAKQYEQRGKHLQQNSRLLLVCTIACRFAVARKGLWLISSPQPGFNLVEDRVDRRQCVDYVVRTCIQ